jgi:hypothetical protein
MQRRSQLLLALSLTLLLQSCAFKKKAQCSALVKDVNKINDVWKKMINIKPPANKTPKTPQEFNALAIDTTTPLMGILQEVDPLISQLEGEEIDEKLLTVYQQNLTFLHVKRSNILRKAVNSIRTLAPGAGIAENAMRSGGSMSESAPVASSEPSSPSKPVIPPIYNGGVSLAGTQFEGHNARMARIQHEQKVRMAELTKALSFLREMQLLDEEIKPQEISIMRRVSASCNIPMPKT